MKLFPVRPVEIGGLILSKTKKRAFTIMLIPHTEESTLSFRVPLLLVQLLSIIAIGVLAFTLIFINNYLKLRAQTEELQHLRDVNRVQKEEIDMLAQQTEELIQWMGQVEQLSEQVRSLIETETEADQGGPVGGTRAISSRSGNEVVNRMAANIAFLREILPGKTEDLETLREDVEEYQRRRASTPSIWPTKGRISSPFGTRRSPFNRYRFEFHTGLDIAASRGTPIYSTADGVVAEVGYQRGWGNRVIINHGYGYRTLYAHLSRYTVTNGEAVKKGDLIGYVGSTGFSTGPHLHYEVHVRGVTVNPRDYLNNQ